MTGKNYDKISPTAIDVAFERAYFTDMPYSIEIFQEARKYACLPVYERMPESIIRLGRFFARSIESVAELEIRYLSTNVIIKSLDDSWAIIEIAAGICPRSLAWATRQAIYIETDLSDMLETKRTIFNTITMNKGIIDNPNHFFSPLNALDEKDWDRIGQQYFADQSRKIAVINEGLLSYLTRDEKSQLRDILKRFFTIYALEGMWVSPDFTNPPSPNVNWIARHVQKSYEIKSERPFDRFRNHKEISDFLTQGGFQAEFPSNEYILDQLTCIPKMHLQKERIRPYLAQDQVCIAKLQKE